jgi:hypothetical protein
MNQHYIKFLATVRNVSELKMECQWQELIWAAGNKGIEKGKNTRKERMEIKLSNGS